VERRWRDRADHSLIRARGEIRAADYPDRVEVAGRITDAFEERVRALEEQSLSPLAVRSYETAGRLHHEDPCRVRTPFQRDRDRLVHSKSFRRLKGKTQVFIDPRGDHYRTRMTHTLETTAISRVVARALGLNEDLTEAIGLGHDVGHPPFGHAGEGALDRILSERCGRRFHHNEQSLRVVDSLERGGRGLNLTREVRDGILKHTGPVEPETLEGRIVRIVDRVAYINHDIDDALRAGVLRPRDLPADEIALLGDTGARRIDRLVHDLVESSAAAGDIVQSEEVGAAMLALRSFMFERVYLGPRAEAEHARAARTIERIFSYLVAHPDEVPPGGPGDEVERATDYVAGMTDRFALAYAERIG
jgi:dGTPase